MSYLMKNTKTQLVGFIEALQDEIRGQQNKIDNLEFAVTEQKDLVAELREELEGSQRVGAAQAMVSECQRLKKEALLNLSTDEDQVLLRQLLGEAP